MREFHISKGLLTLLFLSFISCQNDDYEAPKVTPKEYNFSIPNKLNFKFMQVSESNTSITPYLNSLIVKNISNNAISSSFVTLAFNGDTLSYKNLSFLKQIQTSSIESDSSAAKIELIETSNLFSDNNTILSVLELNTSHEFSGLYLGEISLYNINDDTFVKSFNCLGTIDFQGSFHFFTQDNSEQSITYLKGNFNNENQVSGSVLNSSGDLFSVLQNFSEVPFTISSGSLAGSLLFTDSETSIIKELKFDLTKQN